MKVPFKEMVARFKKLGVEVEERDFHIYFSPTLEEDILDKELIYKNIGLL